MCNKYDQGANNPGTHVTDLVTVRHLISAQQVGNGERVKEGESRMKRHSSVSHALSM